LLGYISDYEYYQEFLVEKLGIFEYFASRKLSFNNFYDLNDIEIEIENLAASI
jgi:hypothetical protein